ncbi:hypothetical protein HK100_006263, partial [Physocladia obscura]
EEEPRYVAVNSYDNVMRVYDRGFSPPEQLPRMVHALKGHKNKNWPIKSSFFRPKDGISSSGSGTILGLTKRNSSTGDDLAGGVSGGGGKGDGIAADGSETSINEPTMLLATGSADPYVYLYSLSSAQGSNELPQRLEGHTDRVYATSFHPTDAILASCSAD